MQNSLPKNLIGYDLRPYLDIKDKHDQEDKIAKAETALVRKKLMTAFAITFVLLLIVRGI